MTRYWLSKHAYVRETGEHAVFLDLRRNKYTSVDREALRDLRALVHGWPDGRGEATGGVSSSDSTQDGDILRLLIREGVLTEDDQFGKEAAPVAVELVTETIDNVRGAYPSITWGDLWNFVSAWLRIAVLLRLLPLSWIVTRIRKRKARSRDPSDTFDPQKAHRLMTAYWILRPNFFEAKGACLRDSLTFIEFFSFYDLYPTLVFGVKMEPFAAHAWVQEGSMVLNDYIPNVTKFAPILAV